ncbi:hypothetical protein [Asticcacaulis excentricus]|uniref:Lipoprotein n=1 Tax=Asticcacaulis excentricus (strain ATCC 15261 / DSM 4724 / KCTC 12464 / NCIMB 9791 / VKM B-1370 / CB 48) TaxID=573065 RepID=E8RW38_ASTEC|nr:hypothetical protein [Asticcacaulis excentricus]ADU15460.1 hypothetical protein Astex_3853 [Asticcacaulis excentricus CB 48]
MNSMKRLNLLALTLAVTTLGACASTPESDKGYTVKVVKMSPAPRDKFYKIVKVPNAPASPATAPKAEASQSGSTDK